MASCRCGRPASGGAKVTPFDTNSDGKVDYYAYVDNTGASPQEYRLRYTYLGASDPNEGQIEKVELARVDAGPTEVVVRSASYAYYESGDNGGPAGTLKLVTKYDGSTTGGEVIGHDYYRYDSNRQVTMVLLSDSYARATDDLNLSDLDNATQAQLKGFADNYFEYDSQGRVTREIAQNAGCSACSGGQGTFDFVYSAENTNADGQRNTWQYKTTEYLPDLTPGTTADNDYNLVYTNKWGQPILKNVPRQERSRQLRNVRSVHRLGPGRVDR